LPMVTHTCGANFKLGWVVRVDATSGPFESKICPVFAYT
jgi:hypothetical protein